MTSRFDYKVTEDDKIMMPQNPTAKNFVFSLLFCCDLASETGFQRCRTSLLYVNLLYFIKRPRVSKGSATQAGRHPKCLIPSSL